MFLTSAAVLVLEILAGRLLAPYSGITLETFTAIIGVVLAGIAAGTWLGGRLADNHGQPLTLLGPALMVGGVLAATSVPIVRLLGPNLGRAGIPGLVILTAMAMLPATAVLSTVSPIVAKIVLADLSETGVTVGRISALGTTGALFGTFTSGFLLVASFRTQTIVVAVSLAMITFGVALMVRFGWPRRLLPLVVLGVGLLAITIGVESPCDVETAYFCASAVEDPDRPGSSFLVLDTITHAYVDPTDPTHLRFTSIRMFASAINAMTEGPVKTVHIGGGGLSVPAWLTATRPGSENVVLELDGSLMDFVTTAFKRTAPDRLLIGDARLSLAEAGSGFDVAVGDAFGGLAVPWHLTTVEFITEVSTTLTDSGLYVMNVIDHGSFEFLRSELATTAAVFPHVAVVTVPERFETGGNFMIVGSRTPIDSPAVISEAATLDLTVEVVSGRDLDRFIGDARVLTDDYAPVDQLIETA